MQFMLPFKFSGPDKKIAHHEKLMLIGSCFSQEIGNKLQYYKWQIFQNPTGIIYNAVSIRDALQWILSGSDLNEQDLYFQDGIWSSFAHHTSFAGVDKTEVLKRINESRRSALVFLKSADWIIITPASSFIYKLRSTGKVVSNCNKAPATLFEKKLLSVEENKEALEQTLHLLKQHNPSIKIMFTVSPVKHYSDGIAENNISKANIFSALYKVLQTHKESYYFPAFEIINDELRDYRFYKNDFSHPNEMAINYVFEKFINSCTEQSTQILLKKIEAILRSCEHKPFNPASKAHIQFVSDVINQINQVVSEQPYIDFSNELSGLRLHLP